VYGYLPTKKQQQQHQQLSPEINNSSGSSITSQPAPTSVSGSSSTTERKALRRSGSKVSDALATALSDQAQFDGLYVGITHKSLSYYKQSGFRYRIMDKLAGDLAALHHLRGDYAQAELMLKSASATYVDEGWHQLATTVRTRLAVCERTLDHAPEYVSSCLALLAPTSTLSLEERYATERERERERVGAR